MKQPLLQRAAAAVRSVAPLLAIVGVIAALGGTALALAVPALRGSALPTAAAGSVLLLIAAVASLGAVRDIVAGRRFRLSGTTLATIAAAIAVVVGVNVIGVVVDVQWDSTPTQQFEFAEQTKQVLGQLDAPVEAVGFLTPGPGALELEARVQSLLEQAARHAAEPFSVAIVDPQLQPSLARARGVGRFPALALAQEDRSVVLEMEQVDEQRLLTGLLELTGAARKQVYFLTGHGERSSTDFRTDSTGFGDAARSLQSDGYLVADLSIRDSGVPADAALVVIAAPVSALAPVEEGRLMDWLADGGRALVLLEPSSPAEVVEQLAGPWGLAAAQGAVADPERSAPGDPGTLILHRDQYPSGASITDGSVILDPLEATLLPGVAALLPTPEVEARLETGAPLPVVYSPLATTSSTARLDSGGDEDSGAMTLTVAVALQATSKLGTPPYDAFDAGSIATSMVVVGDSDFASNRHLDDLANRDLFLNAVAWLTDDVHLIAVRPAQGVFRPIVLTAAEFNLVRYLSWFLLPAIAASLAAVAWWRRR